MFIDTHCHIHDPEYNFDTKETLRKAHYAGVEKIIVIGTSPEDSTKAHTFAAQHPGVYWTYGFHPGETTTQGADPRTTLQKALGGNLPTGGSGLSDEPRVKSTTLQVRASNLRSRANLTSVVDFTHGARRHKPEPPVGKFPATKLVAIGEIGLDYHYEPYSREQQINRLEQYLQLAQETHLPVIYHVREAFADFWPIISNFQIQTAVLHSFSDSPENLSQAINRNLFIGINGLATFAKIPIPPLEHIVLETDAPYLTPAPFRGKINEPAYIPEIAQWVADHFGTTLEKVAEITTHNATRLYHI